MAPDDHDHHLELTASLDFINTLEHSQAGDSEELASFGDALGWLVAHGAMHAEAAEALSGRQDVDGGLDEVREVRRALRDVVDAVVDERSPSVSALGLLNRTLAAEPVSELVATSDGVVVTHRHEADPLADALSRIVHPIVDTLAEGRPDRLRVCANDHCRWVFYDTSPTGRRRWCDMSSCGNRAKAARHRARRRSETKGA